MHCSAFDLFRPERHTSCVVFASPHSGRTYDAEFLQSSVLDSHVIRSSEDAYVDRLFDGAPSLGAPFLAANMPRSYVDLNRACDELDPALIDGVRAQGHNPRVASGLGVIPRVVANGRAIYRGKLKMSAARDRIERIWHPYHRMLQMLLDEAQVAFGQAVLIDCHSMPHEAMDGISRGSMRRPDIVLGDRFGAAASGSIVDEVEAAFANAGFTVTRNAPFAGAYITQAYGRPARRQHAVQVEIDRSIYMDEKRVAPHGGFDDVRARLHTVMAQIAQIGQEALPVAAE